MYIKIYVCKSVLNNWTTHLEALACTKLDVIGQEFHAAVNTTRISRGQRKQLYGHNLHNRRLFSRARSGDIERVSRSMSPLRARTSISIGNSCCPVQYRNDRIISRSMLLDTERGNDFSCF